MTTRIDEKIAQARRLYHHMVNGGEVKLKDMGYLVEALEEAQRELEDLHRQNYSLALRLTVAHKRLDLIYWEGDNV